MKIFPAIDLRDGKCVRLTKGAFESEKIYNEDPLNQVEIFKNAGLNHLHIVDLDGALKGNLVNFNVIKKIIEKFDNKVQVGGGIRSMANVSKLVDIGADKVILGTAAIKDINFLEDCCKKHPSRIALALDVRNNKIATSGWKEQTRINVLEYLESVKSFGISRLIFTDIEKDGTNLGPNFFDSYQIADKFDLPLVVSGGISSINDIKKIINENKKVEGIIIGKAIYEKRIELSELSGIK
jgi:phosphoribosylformimino-5-aminoimidazole carboxamide ribotide isomerase